MGAGEVSGYDSIENIKDIARGYKVATFEDFNSLLVSVLPNLDTVDLPNRENYDEKMQGQEGVSGRDETNMHFILFDYDEIKNSPSVEKRNFYTQTNNLYRHLDFFQSFFIEGADGDLDVVLYLGSSLYSYGNTSRYIKIIDNLYGTTRFTDIFKGDREAWMDRDLTRKIRNYPILFVKDISAPAAFGSLALLGLAGLRRKSK